MTVRVVNDYSELRVGQHITLYVEPPVSGVITGVKRQIEHSGRITALIDLTGRDVTWAVSSDSDYDIVIYKEAELEGEEVSTEDIREGDLIAVHNIMSSKEWLEKVSDEELRKGLTAKIPPESDYVELHTQDGRHCYTLAVREGWAELRRLKQARGPRRGEAIKKSLLLRGDTVDVYARDEDGKLVVQHERWVPTHGGGGIAGDEFRLIKPTQNYLNPYPLTREQAIHRAPVGTILLDPEGDTLARVEYRDDLRWAQITHNFGDIVDLADEHIEEGDYTVLHWPTEDESTDGEEGADEEEDDLD